METYRRYDLSARGRARNHKYRASPKGRLSLHNYDVSLKGLERHREFRRRKNVTPTQD